MADFATALRGRLIANAQVAAVTTRIYWGVAPQTTATLPYIVLNTISDPLDEHLKGYTATQRPRVQADCFASTYGAARGLAQKVITAVAEPATYGGVAFNRIRAEGPVDRGEDTANGFVFRASVDLLVEHKLV